jgi:CelD/BcsL family acetyltransferase involved in cellulose biosynthesis
MNSVALKTSEDLPVDGEFISPQAVASPNLLRLEIIADEAQFLELAPHWDKLVDRSVTRSPFLRWDWVSLWWEEYREQFQLAVAVVRDVWGMPLAIAPMVTGRSARNGARRHLRQLVFMGGDGDICAQILDFIIPGGFESVLAPLLCNAIERLRPRWDMVRLDGIPETSPNLPYILEAMRACGNGACVVNRHTSRFIKMPANWADFEMTRSGSWRSKMRRKWKAMEQVHQGRTLLGGRDSDVDDAMRDLFTLHAHRFPAEVSEFLLPHVKRFQHKLARRWVPTGRMMLPYIEVAGTPAAVMQVLVEGDTLYQYQMGWNPAFADISIGNLVMAWSVRCALERGAAIYDTLPGEFEYKDRWCPETRHFVDLEAFNSLSISGAVFRGLRAMKRLTSARSETPNCCGESAVEPIE